MKNKVVRKLLMVGLSSSVVLTSTVGVTAASMDATTDAVVENAAEAEVLTPVADEDALAEETAEEETTEETGEEVAEEDTATEAAEDLQLVVPITVYYVDQNDGSGVGNEVINAKVYNGYYTLSSKDFTVPAGYKLVETGDFSGPYTDSAYTAYVKKVETPEHEAKTVTVNYKTDDGAAVGKGSITVEPQYTSDGQVYYQFNGTQLTDVPENYEIANLGDYDVTNTDAVDVIVRKKAAETKTVYVSFIDEETKQPLEKDGIQAIEIGAKDAIFNTSKLTAPKGYEICKEGDVYVGEDGTTVNVEVRKVAETKTVYVSFIDEETKQPLENGIQEIKIGANDTIFNTSKLTAPKGYEISNPGDVYVGEDGDTVNVEVRKVAETRTVYVSFIDEETKQPLENGIQEIKIGAEDTMFNTSKLTAPEGYEICNQGDVYVEKNDTVNVEVRRAGAETRTIYVSLVTESGDVISSNQEIEIVAGATTFNTSRLAVPKGYELCQVGDMYIGNGDTMNVFVREVQVVTDKNIIVNYVDEENKNVGTQDLVVGADDTYVNTSKLNVPYGYELVNVGDLAFNADNTLTVQVRAKEYTKDVTVNYVDEAGNPVLTTSIKLAEDATYFNTNILTDVPYGWIIAVVGDIPLNEDGTATVVVREKKYTKDVVINYVDELGNNVATSGITVDDAATYFNTSILTDVPYGWELASVGDITINEDNTANVVVREKVYQRDVVINYVDEAGNSVATSGIKLDENATYFNTSILTDVPYGWELVNVGDIPVDFETNSANVVVREKAYTKDVVINYVDEEGNNVLTSGIKLDKDATYFNTGILTDVPYGWELANVGDIPVNEDNTATVVVRQKKYTRDVTVKYVTEDGKEVGTGALVVDEKDTYINTSILADVPEGYVIAVVGDLPIEDNTVVVTVRAEKVDPENPNPENPDPENPTPDPENPTPNPENPDQPVDPEKPDQNKPTVAPEKPNNNNQNNDQNTTDANKSEVKTNNPKTGDATNTVPLVAGLLGSGSMIGLIQMLRRKKK